MLFMYLFFSVLVRGKHSSTKLNYCVFYDKVKNNNNLENQKVEAKKEELLCFLFLGCFFCLQLISPFSPPLLSLLYIYIYSTFLFFFLLCLHAFLYIYTVPASYAPPFFVNYKMDVVGVHKTSMSSHTD